MVKVIEWFVIGAGFLTGALLTLCFSLLALHYLLLWDMWVAEKLISLIPLRLFR